MIRASLQTAGMTDSIITSIPPFAPVSVPDFQWDLENKMMMVFQEKPFEEHQPLSPDSVTACMTDSASISPAAPASDHNPHWDVDNSTTLMAVPSLELSLGREAPALSPSIPDVEEDMSSTNSGRGPSSSPEGPTTDLNIYPMDKFHSLLDKCLVRVREMPSRQFNNEQCGYLVGKLKETLRTANLFLGPNSKPQTDVKLRTSEGMTRCTEVFKFFLALALKIESFIQACCKNEWLQAAMTTSTNTAEYVASLGFNLELCGVYFSAGWTATKALTAAQADEIERKEVEIVKGMASLDVDVLLDKVKLKLRSLQGENKDLASYLSQRLERVKPAATTLSPKSPFRILLERMFEMVRQSELLGKGSSATVHKAVWLGIPVAKKTFYGPEHPDYLREVQILEGLCHPNVMSMFCCAMDKRKCSIVMELMDEDLHSFMEKRLGASPDSPPFSVFEAVDVILQIGEGVNYLHQNGIVHRDLKSSNILVKNLLSPNLRNVLPSDVEVQYVLIKVADFGFSKIKESSTRYSNQTLNIGTNRWMPPEVINIRNNDGQASSSVPQAGPKYPKKSDVYSFAMVCYEVLTGDVPFPQEPSQVNVKKMVLRGERPTLPDYCPSELKALIEACWDPQPTNRPSFGRICSSLKHLKCLLISGFHSNEESPVKIGEPLQIEAPSREMRVQKRPVEEGLQYVLSNTTKKFKAAAIPTSAVNSSPHSVNGDDTREPFRSSVIQRSSTNTATGSEHRDLWKLVEGPAGSAFNSWSEANREIGRQSSPGLNIHKPVQFQFLWKIR